jgi:hypothetical protein
MRSSERPPALRSRFQWLGRLSPGPSALPAAVAHLFLVRRMRTFGGAVVVATLLLCCSAAHAENPANDYARLIVGGRWLGADDLKYRIFYADGRWAVQRNDSEAPDSSGNRRWWIKDDTLIYTYQHWRYTERILSISRTRLVTGDRPGYVRVRSSIPKRRDTSNQSLQPTADRLDSSLSMKSHPQPAATRHSASGG